MKSGKNGKRFQRRRHLKIYTIFYMQKALGQGQIPSENKVLNLNNKFYYFSTLIIHYKFQPLVFNTFLENDFSTFCLEMQI